MEALQHAWHLVLHRGTGIGDQAYGTPEIFNADQGSRFTSDDFTGKLKSRGIKISMDGKGRWIGNVFIERLWRSVKYQDIYIKEYR